MPLFGYSQADLNRMYDTGMKVGRMKGYMEGFEAAQKMAELERKVAAVERRVKTLKDDQTHKQAGAGN